MNTDIAKIRQLAYESRENMAKEAREKAAYKDIIAALTNAAKDGELKVRVPAQCLDSREAGLNQLDKNVINALQQDGVTVWSSLSKVYVSAEQRENGLSDFFNGELVAELRTRQVSFLAHLSTVELVTELKTREGVDDMYFEPHIGFEIEAPYQSMSESGPATILIVKD